MVIVMPKSFFMPIAYVDEKFLDLDRKSEDDFREKDYFNIYDIIDEEYSEMQRKRNI